MKGKIIDNVVDVHPGRRRSMIDGMKMEKVRKDYANDAGFGRKVLLRESLIDGGGMIDYGGNNKMDSKARAMLMLEAIEGILQMHGLDSEEGKEGIRLMRGAILENWPIPYGQDPEADKILDDFLGRTKAPVKQ